MEKQIDITLSKKYSDREIIKRTFKEIKPYLTYRYLPITILDSSCKNFFWLVHLRTNLSKVPSCIVATIPLVYLRH